MKNLRFYLHAPLAVFVFCGLLPTAAFAQAGLLDPTFSGDGIVVTSMGIGDQMGTAIVLQPDGKIVVAGSDNGEWALARYNTDGTLDSSFSADGLVNTTAGSDANAVALQPDGKIVVAGTTGYDIAVARYNSDGSPDLGFDGDGFASFHLGIFGSANGVAVQADGKIVLAGDYFNGNDQDIILLRYNADGSLDNSFDTDGIMLPIVGTSSDDRGNAIILQPDGKILVAGAASLGTAGRFGLIRILPDGSWDTSFDTDGLVATTIGLSAIAKALALQPDGKIILTGTVNGDDIAIARYNPDGSLDLSFDGDGIARTTTMAIYENAYGVALQRDGRILVCGGSYSGNYDVALFRYESDGSVDLSFGAAGIVLTQLGTYSEVAYSLALQSDDKILAAGYTDNGPDFDIAVLRYTNDIPVSVPSAVVEPGALQVFPNPSSGWVTISKESPNLAELMLYDAFGELVLHQEFKESTQIQLQQKGIYVARVIEGKKVYSRKIIVQ